MWFCCVLLLKSLFQSPLYQRELALTSTPDGKSPPQLTLVRSVCLCFSFTFSVFVCSFKSSRRSLTVAFTHLYLHTHTHTRTMDCRVSLQSDWDTVVGMCHSFIIDQIQLPSSTDHLETDPCVFFSVISLLSSQNS